MNFDTLSQKIEDATKKAFLELFEKHGADEIYAFALYSDEGAMTVCPSTNTLKHLATVDRHDLIYYKFEPAEWKYEMVGADQDFNQICDQLSVELDNSDLSFKKFQQQLYSTCIDVLEKLKNNHFFSQIVGKEIFLMFTVSDYDFKPKEIKNMIVRLNDNDYRTEYLNYIKSWS